MAGHPSVKKRQKELERKERQAEKLARRDERRVKRNEPATDGEPALEGELGDQPGGDQPAGDQPAVPANVAAEVPAAPPQLTAQDKP